MHFYELLAEFNEGSKKELRELYKEANELLSIIVASINTTLKNMAAESAKGNSLKTNLKSAI